MNPFRVALTGGIGSGKTTASAEFARLGAGVIDADAISRQLTAAGGAALPDIASAFGADAIGADGAMDRGRMRARILADEGERRRLESILHPWIARIAAAQAQEFTTHGAAVLIFDIPLLIESGASGPLRTAIPPHRILVIDCPIHRQIERTLARGTLRRCEVEAIVAAQASRTQRLAAADDIVVNDGSADDLRARIGRFWKVYAGHARVAGVVSAGVDAADVDAADVDAAGSDPTGAPFRSSSA